MKQRTLSWLLVASAVLAALLVLGSILTLERTRELNANSDWVSHTQEVITSIERLWGTIKATEAGHRGYIITGDPAYLDSYEAARQDYPDELKHIAELTRDNEIQRANLEDIRNLIGERFEEMDTVRKRFASDGFAVAQQRIMEGRGKRVSEELRKAFDSMAFEEEGLLIDRESIHARAYRTAVTTTVMTMVLGLMSLFSFVFLLRRHFSALSKASDLIHEQHNLLQATLISIGDGVIVTDAEGRVTLLNDVAQKLTGWTTRDAAAVPLETVFHIVNEASRERVENPAVRAIREGRIMGLANHTILVAKNGQEWPIDDSAAPIRDQSGQISGAVLVFREIVERKRQDQALRQQSQELAANDQRKDEFLATLAHELRNPLAPISNALQLWPFVENDKTQLENLRTMMQRQVGQMARLIDDLMDISRINSGKIRMQTQVIDCNTLVASALESVQPQLDAREHQVTLSLSKEPLWIEGDVARLTQVFGNILNNAAKYLSRAGVVWITAQAQDGKAVVSIRDNGPGIPPHLLGEIFEMFRQVDGTLERSHGGLGIGLTLVKRIVEAHHGTVVANSAGPGQGSEFIVTLPLAPGSARPQAGHQLQQRPALAQRRILVVDDIEASATTLSMMLRGLGQQVEALQDPLLAVEWIRAHDPDIVFLDIAMPGMSGYDVARQVRQGNGERPPYLVALTGYGQESDRQQAFAAGFNRHLVKPASMDALVEVLQTAGSRG